MDRCLVIHMERAPKNSKRSSTRVRAVARDTKPLLARLEGYEVQ